MFSDLNFAVCHLFSPHLSLHPKDDGDDDDDHRRTADNDRDDRRSLLSVRARARRAKAQVRVAVGAQELAAVRVEAAQGRP